MNGSEKEYDVLIIGGGPAGIAAGIWCSELGMSSAIIERGSELGGQLLNILNPIENYPGVFANNGTELRDLFLKNMKGRSCEVYLSCEVVSFDLEKLEVSAASGLTFKGKAIVLAMGVRRRRLGVPGEDEFTGKGILHSGAKEAATVEGKRVLVVGGGDAAVENALILSKFAGSLILVHRGTKLSARREFVERVSASSNIKVLFENEVRSFDGEGKLSSVRLADTRTRAETVVEIDNALIRIGFQANSACVGNQVIVDPEGYVTTDRMGKTSACNVLAIGDLSNPIAQTIASATGNAATAGKHLKSGNINLKKNTKI